MLAKGVDGVTNESKPKVSLSAILDGVAVDLDDDGLFGRSAEGIELPSGEKQQLATRKISGGGDPSVWHCAGQSS
eukprot:5974351-Pyramimonas_sp.AAC.1